MKWMILPYLRYADFSGRSRRLEYWMFTLFYVLVIFGLIVMGGALGALESSAEAPDGLGVGGTVMIALLGIFLLGSFIPQLAVQVRRFHDQDKSGWMVLLGLIPYVGGLIVLIFMFADGTPGENSYGPDPKGPGYDVDTFS